MNVAKESIYPVRYIRIIGWTSLALSICTFISAIAIHGTPQYPDYYQNPVHVAFAVHNMHGGSNLPPSGQGFVASLLLGFHTWASYIFTRPKKRREPEWPSRKMYYTFVAACGICMVWGVVMAVWDIMIASGTYYKAFRNGEAVQGFLYLEVALGLFMTGITTASLLLVYNTCKFNNPTTYADNPPRGYQQRSRSNDINTISGSNAHNNTVTWVPPSLPDGEAPPSYSDRHARPKKGRKGIENAAFEPDQRAPRYSAPTPSQWI
jgi:hypothetical protein